MTLIDAVPAGRVRSARARPAGPLAAPVSASALRAVEFLPGEDRFGGGRVYALTDALNPNAGIVFVGSTVHAVESRLLAHARFARLSVGNALAVWVRRVGAENVLATVLETLPGDVSEAEVLAAEERWAGLVRRSGRALVNRSERLSARRAA